MSKRVLFSRDLHGSIICSFRGIVSTPWAMVSSFRIWYKVVVEIDTWSKSTRIYSRELVSAPAGFMADGFTGRGWWLYLPWVFVTSFVGSSFLKSRNSGCESRVFFGGGVWLFGQDVLWVWCSFCQCAGSGCAVSGEIKVHFCYMGCECWSCYLDRQSPDVSRRVQRPKYCDKQQPRWECNAAVLPLTKSRKDKTINGDKTCFSWVKVFLFHYDLQGSFVCSFRGIVYQLWETESSFRVWHKVVVEIDSQQKIFRAFK